MSTAKVRPKLQEYRDRVVEHAARYGHILGDWEDGIATCEGCGKMACMWYPAPPGGSLYEDNGVDGDNWESMDLPVCDGALEERDGQADTASEMKKRYTKHLKEISARGHFLVAFPGISGDRCLDMKCTLCGETVLHLCKNGEDEPFYLYRPNCSYSPPAETESPSPGRGDEEVEIANLEKNVDEKYHDDFRREAKLVIEELRDKGHEAVEVMAFDTCLHFECTDCGECCEVYFDEEEGWDDGSVEEANDCEQEFEVTVYRSVSVTEVAYAIVYAKDREEADKKAIEMARDGELNFEFDDSDEYNADYWTD